MSDAELRNEWEREVLGGMGERFWKNLTLQKLREFIAAGVDVNAEIYDGDRSETVLHRAVYYSENPEIIKELINAGANVHARDSDGWTPLHSATSKNNNAYIIKELINAGADVNAKSKSDKMPLHTAAVYNKSTENIKELIKNDAGIPRVISIGYAKGFSEDENGRTPYDLLSYNHLLKDNEEAKALLKPIRY